MCPGNIYLFLLYNLFLLASPLCCLFALELWYEFPAYPTLICLICFLEYWDRIFLCLQDAVLKDLSAFLSYFAFQNCLLQNPTDQFLNKFRVAHLKSRFWTAPCSILTNLRSFNSTTLKLLQPRILLIIIFQINSSFLVLINIMSPWSQGRTQTNIIYPTLLVFTE